MIDRNCKHLLQDHAYSTLQKESIDYLKAASPKLKNPLGRLLIILSKPLFLYERLSCMLPGPVACDTEINKLSIRVYDCLYVQTIHPVVA